MPGPHQRLVELIAFLGTKFGESSGPTEAGKLDWRREQSIMSFSVEDFHDLLRLLEERPEWRVEIRRVVLTEDLLRLPEELARARQETEQRFQELAARIDALAARIDALAAQVSALTVRLEALTTQVSALTGHVGTLRGESLEQRYRTRVFAYFGRLLRGAHALAPDELTALFEDAIAAAELSDEEAQEIALADVVVRGMTRSVAPVSTSNSTHSARPLGPVSRPRTRKSPIASECSEPARFPSMLGSVWRRSAPAACSAAMPAPVLEAAVM